MAEICCGWRIECCCCCYCYDDENDSNSCGNIPSCCLENLLFITLILSIGMIIYLPSQLGVSNIASYNIVLIFLILAALVICVLFVFFFKYWRCKDVIKTTKQNRAAKMSMAGIFLILFILVLSLICEILILKDLKKTECDESSSNSNNNNNYNYNYNNNYNYNFYNDNYSNSNKKNKPCKSDYSDTNSQATISSFSLIEFLSVLSFVFFCILNFQISLAIVDPNQSNDKKSEISNEIPYNVDPENQVNVIPNSQVSPQINIIQIQINNVPQNDKLNNNLNNNQNNIINNHKKINKKLKNTSNNVNKQTNDSKVNSSNYPMKFKDFSSQRKIKKGN